MLASVRMSRVLTPRSAKPTKAPADLRPSSNQTACPEGASAEWGSDSPSGEKTVDVTIHTLREKVEDDPAHPRWIQTVRGYGYRFHPPEAAEAQPVKSE